VNTSERRIFRIATRESQLALWQANYVAEEIRRLSPEFEVLLVPMTTSGDRDLTSSLPQMGGQGVFTREVQKAVLDGQADLAVHSLKDLPTEDSPGLVLAAVPPRAPRFDALVLPHGQTGTLQDLPTGAKIGTSSPRRKSQLLRVRPDLQLEEIRGNVETRLRKVDNGEFAATILAEAGLRRLGLEGRISSLLTPPVMYPAVGQAALGIECRANDAECREVLSRLIDPTTFAEVQAERTTLRTLRAGCHAPVGCITSVSGEILTLEAVVLSLDGTQIYEAKVSGSLTDAEKLGAQAAEDLVKSGASSVLQ
jgi:hydroxymethylbilane synthase